MSEMHRRAAIAGLTLAVAAVACGGSRIDVPDVTGKSIEYAEGQLEGAGLEVSVQRVETDEAEPGNVIGQEPTPGSALEPSETVTIRVAEAPTYEVAGTFTLEAVSGGPANNCRGTGGYDDIQGGLNVRVSDGEGNIIATTELSAGSNEGGGYCSFTFLLEVPKEEFYVFEVGHRGEISYSFEELEANDWRVDFSLG